MRDTSVFGPTSPILGGPLSRRDLVDTVGELSITQVLIDHRRYYMPVQPYTIAARLVHLGRTPSSMVNPSSWAAHLLGVVDAPDLARVMAALDAFDLLLAATGPADGEAAGTR